jgi:hypothetical protein
MQNGLIRERALELSRSLSTGTSRHSIRRPGLFQAWHGVDHRETFEAQGSAP